MEHPRTRYFDVCFDAPPSAAREERLKVIMFNKNERLRSHAVKHLMNATERDDWEAILGFSISELVLKSHSMLKDLGCPFFTLETYTPPCERGKSMCRTYEKCEVMIEKLETIYLEAVEKVIDFAAKRPRHARYRNKDDHFINVMLADIPLVAKLTRLESEDTCNVMTCYRPVQGGFATPKEAREQVRRRILHEKKGQVDWATPQTWGLAESDDEGFSEEKQKKRKKPKTERIPYRAGGASNWRRYLENME